MTELHTLDARGNVLLEVIQDMFHLDPVRLMREIRLMLSQTQAILRSKGIEYRELKTALVPSRKSREVALFFDRRRIDSGWYGLPVIRRILPFLSRTSSHCVKMGDCLGEGKDQEWLELMLRQSLRLANEYDFRHSNDFFVVYVNNVSAALLESMHSELRSYIAYVGCIDLTFSSHAKTYLSTVLAQAFLQHRGFVIQGHPDDVDNSEDQNANGYPYEERGFVCRSLQDSLYGVFLSYKIERPVFPGQESDTLFSLNAVSPRPKPLAEFGVRVDLSKFDYLKREKSGSLERIGMADFSTKELETLVREKVSSNYIYSMSHNEAHGTVKFNLLFEVTAAAASRVRVLVALEYLPDELCLRLITLY